MTSIRYASFSLLKWTVQFALVAFLFRYVLPPSWSGYQISAPIWVLAFCLTFAGAMWALAPVLPGKRESLQLVGVWLLLSITLYLFQSYYFFGTVRPFVNSFEVYIQYGCEVLAIFLAAYITRRRKIKAVLGEGLSE